MFPLQKRFSVSQQLRHNFVFMQINQDMSLLTLHTLQLSDKQHLISVWF